MTDHQHSEALTELAKQAITELIPDHENAIITRGVLIAEILNSDDESRSVYGIQQGTSDMSPWDVIGLIRVVEVRAEFEIARGVTDD